MSKCSLLVLYSREGVVSERYRASQYYALGLRQMLDWASSNAKDLDYMKVFFRSIVWPWKKLFTQWCWTIAGCNFPFRELAFYHHQPFTSCIVLVFLLIYLHVSILLASSEEAIFLVLLTFGLPWICALRRQFRLETDFACAFFPMKRNDKYGSMLGRHSK